MVTRHVHILRAVALCVVAGWFVVLFRYGMAADRYMMLFQVAGTSLFAALTAFAATFVYGPLSFPRGSNEAMMSRGLLAILALGLIVVGSGLARSLLASVAGAA